MVTVALERDRPVIWKPWGGGGVEPPTRWILKYCIPPLLEVIAWNCPGAICWMLAVATVEYGPDALEAASNTKYETTSLFCAEKLIQTTPLDTVIPVISGTEPPPVEVPT